LNLKPGKGELGFQGEGDEEGETAWRSVAMTIKNGSSEELRHQGKRMTEKTTGWIVLSIGTDLRGGVGLKKLLGKAEKKKINKGRRAEKRYT